MWIYISRHIPFYPVLYQPYLWNLPICIRFAPFLYFYENPWILNVSGILADNDSYLKIIERNFFKFYVILYIYVIQRDCVEFFFLLNQKHAFDIWKKTYWWNLFKKAIKICKIINVWKEN